MAVEWAGLGPELLLKLDREQAEPLRAQLERELREAIRSGRLRAGERLPSSRVLAKELGISRNLVLDCYTQLQAEGYLSGRTGSGTRVAAGAHEPEPPATAEPDEPNLHKRRLAIDFRHWVPDLTSFPRNDWAWALRLATRDVTAMDLGYQDPRGSQALREVLAGYLRRVRGAVTDPHRIVICNGVIQGANLVIRALAEQGVKRVAFEDPGHADQRMGAPLVGVKPIPVPVDEHGVDVTKLAASGARAVVLTPAHQSPTGGVLAPERRHALVAWAHEHDATIIEDDYDAEFRYDREPVGVLQGLAPDHVALVSSVSKTLAPGLRVGWAVCPPRMADQVAHLKDVEDRGFPIIDQLALAALIESGRYDRHLRRMRGVYASRRQALADALQRHVPGVELLGLEAGFHAVVILPEGATEEEVVTGAEERGVGVYGLADSAFGESEWPPPWPPALVLGFSGLSEEAIDRGIAKIADLLS
jgi:GntR family transcriptional regulator/MocR family aminotransferase